MNRLMSDDLLLLHLGDDGELNAARSEVESGVTTTGTESAWENE